MNSILDIPYERFIEDLATRTAVKQHELQDNPEWISQNQAWKRFKKATVNRWLAMGKKLRVRKNGQRVEYKYADLLVLDNSII